MTDMTDEQLDALWRAPMSADWEHREFARAVLAAADAENAALRADNTRLQNEVVGPLREQLTAQDAHEAGLAEAQAYLMARVKMLEDALHNIERVMGPTTPPCCGGCAYEWCEALRTARAALEAK